MPPTVRSWNALLLSALLSPNTASTTNLFSNLRSFTPIYTNSLAFLVSFEATNKSDSAALDLDQAFTAIKLWMMLSRRKPPKGIFDQEEDVVLNKGTDLGMEEAAQDNRDRTVWNELWPAFENVLSASAAEGSEELTVSLVILLPGHRLMVVILVAFDPGHLVLLCRACHLFTPIALTDRSRDISCPHDYAQEPSQAH